MDMKVPLELPSSLLRTTCATQPSPRTYNIGVKVCMRACVCLRGCVCAYVCACVSVAWDDRSHTVVPRSNLQVCVCACVCVCECVRVDVILNNTNLSSHPKAETYFQVCVRVCERACACSSVWVRVGAWVRGCTSGWVLCWWCSLQLLRWTLAYEQPWIQPHLPCLRTLLTLSCIRPAPAHYPLSTCVDVFIIFEWDSVLVVWQLSAALNLWDIRVKPGQGPEKGFTPYASRIMTQIRAAHGMRHTPHLRTCLMMCLPHVSQGTRCTGRLTCCKTSESDRNVASLGWVYAGCVTHCHHWVWTTRPNQVWAWIAYRDTTRDARSVNPARRTCQCPMESLVSQRGEGRGRTNRTNRVQACSQL